MGEEFEESEVIFSDEYNVNNYYLAPEEITTKKPNKRGKNTINNYNKSQGEQGWKTTGSLPVEIPRNIWRLSEYDDWSEEEYCNGGEVVPPHVIIGRRVEGKMGFSVCTGNGRTLKGRVLSEVRNYILKLTGFLET